MTIDPSHTVRQRPPFLAIGLLSATALGYEILLIRLFSIIQWHHFAYMIISLALLGYGASGTFLSFTQTRLLKRYPSALFANLVLFGLTAMPGFLIVQRIPFNPQELLWSWTQPLWLTFIYLLLSLPFFFAANAIALTLANYRTEIPRIYAVDLLGAGIGSLVVILLLYALFPLSALSLVSVLAMACVAIAAWELHIEKRGSFTAAALTAAAVLLWFAQGSTLILSPYKSISQSLRIDGARLVAEYHSPLGLLQVVENKRIPLRHAPGLSVNAGSGPPAQLGVFSDGNSVGVITRDSGDGPALDFLGQLTSALPYHLKKPNRVLVLGAGGGMDILQARYQGAGRIDAVELDPQMLELVTERFGEFSGRLYQHPDVHLHTAEGRGFIGSHETRYDLIQHTLQGSFGASSAGLYSLSESYLYTLEALQTYLARVTPGGYLCISQWIKLPPRDTLKLFATAVDALRRSGIERPGKQLMLIRGWQTSTLVIKNGGFTAAEIAAMRNFSRARAFDVAWYPGISADQANRYNILREPYFYQAAQALLGAGRQAFMERYKFNLQPASDDRPYFHNFFKWSTLEEILGLRGRGGMLLLEVGYPVLIATVIQALLASALLIVLPLAFVRRKQDKAPCRVSRVRVLVYFSAIGLAFLFLEIAFIQKFMRFLHHPLFAAAAVLASFLVFAGLGSHCAQRLTTDKRQVQGVTGAVGGIVVVGTVYLMSLDALFGWLMAWPMVARIAVSILLIAPLAFLMGLPFPLALSGLGDRAAALIPLAWGVNGCASVLSAVLATLLAIHWGFSAVVGMALLLYILAAFTFPARPGRE